MKPKMWFWLFLIIELAACTARQTPFIPQQTDDGWQTTTPAAVGLDESKLREAVKHIQDKTYQNVDSLLIVKDGKLVFETYFDGHEWNYDSPQFRGKLVRHGPETRHNLASVTKSVTSILVGIALDQGKIQSVDDPVFDYFPQYAHLSDTRKATITLKHLLTMSSGLQWNEGELPYSDPNNDLVRLFSKPDPIEYILSRPLVSEPGARFYYGGDNTNLLGEAIRSATEQRMDAFAEEVLFGPLGITDYAWDFINPDMIHASGNLQLRPRDMAKLGQLYLNGGAWEGHRIVSEAWVAESTQKHITRSATSGYGYQWWLSTYRMGSSSVDAFSALGWGGQKIMVFPDLEMVVVFTGGNYASEDPSEEILTRYILEFLHNEQENECRRPS
jgi:CubicO group peptidase (beta-lactamase class C family)